MNVIRLGTWPGELEVFVGAVSGEASVGEQLLLVILVQPQRRGDDPHRRLSRSGVANSSSASSRCSPARRDAYQIQRRNIDFAAKSSAGVRSGITVLYFRPPDGTLDGTASGRNCGSVAATRFNISRTSSGGSSTEKTVVTSASGCPAAG